MTAPPRSLDRGFLGYRRQEGLPGIRNQILILATELSSRPWAVELTASAPSGEQASGDTAACGIVHKQGIGNFRGDRVGLARVLEGLVTHPNVGAVVLITSGNEDYDVSRLAELSVASGRLSELFMPERYPSTRAMLAAGRRAVARLFGELSTARRSPQEAAALRIGLNCAGTDRVSAVTSNLLCGSAMDRMAASGATPILSEIPEMVGLEEELGSRCVDEETGALLRATIERHKGYLVRDGGDMSENELCAFNSRGGLATLQEKARVSVLKGGSGPIRNLISYGGVPRRTGLTVMDGPALTDFVMTGLLGAGAQLMINCCGAGPANRMPTLVGAATLTAVLPVLKCSGGSSYARKRENRIDVDAGSLQEHPEHLDELTEELVAATLRVASGEHTRTEKGGIHWLNYPLQYHQA